MMTDDERTGAIAAALQKFRDEVQRLGKKHSDAIRRIVKHIEARKLEELENQLRA